MYAYMGIRENGAHMSSSSLHLINPSPPPRCPPQPSFAAAAHFCRRRRHPPAIGRRPVDALCPKKVSLTHSVGTGAGLTPPSTAMSAPAAAIGLHFRKSASVSLCRCLCFPISGPHPSRHCFRILPLTSLPKPLSTIGQDVGSDVRTSSCS